MRKNRICGLDAQIFVKGITWALRYEPNLKLADAALIDDALERGKQRRDAIAGGKQPWAVSKGRLIRGYVSTVDGSVQPYRVSIPASYDPAKPMRLDVVLHGSMRSYGLSELQWMHGFDDGDDGRKGAPERDYIELQPLGRVGENAYRFEGETEVFEAIEAVCRNYNIDRDRIVLRGMSLGGVGTWQIGLKHPDRFVALGPYAGPADTLVFSHAGPSHFIPIEELEPWQEKTLRLMDGIDYTANAGMVPVVAGIGKKDPYYLSQRLMDEMAEREGVKITTLISPNTAHAVDPAVFEQQMKQIAEYAAKGLDRAPRKIRFVTWTLKYSRCHWIQVLGLKEHYARTEVRAAVMEDGSVEFEEVRNVTRLAILSPILQNAGTRLRIAGADVAGSRLTIGRRPLVVEWRNGKWAYIGDCTAIPNEGKRPGLQGPIDDAFATRFVCVRGTGRAWNPVVSAWADASLKRFVYEWNRYQRGDLPVKNDTDVTEADVRNCNLILFGDPGSNSWIARVLPGLPISWTRTEVRFGKEVYPAADNAPVLIAPNPLPGADGRYVVLNSGHTYHECQKAYSLSFLVYPRLGDWAILKVGGNAPENPADAARRARVLKSGFFDELPIGRLPASQSRNEIPTERREKSMIRFLFYTFCLIYLLDVPVTLGNGPRSNGLSSGSVSSGSPFLPRTRGRGLG